MFRTYPKTRPPLPPRYKEIYLAHYKENREGRSFASRMAQRLERWMHIQVAMDVVRRGHGGATLEIGAGTLNHLDYEPNTSPYDIVEPFSELHEGSPLASRLRHIYADISDLAPGSRYERILAIAALEHICDLPRVVAASGLLLQDGGQFRSAIPTEGSWLWRLGWKLTTGLEFRIRHGLDYAPLLEVEHVNNAEEIEAVLAYFFHDVEDRFLGLSRSVSIYRVFFCSSVRRDRCLEYLRGANS